MLSIFEKVWSMSVTASVVIGIVLIARLLLKRTPKWISYALWAVVLFRLLCPVSIASTVSVIPEPVLDVKAPEVSFDIPVQEQDPVAAQPAPDFGLPLPENIPMEDLILPGDVSLTQPEGVFRPVQTVSPAQEESFRFPMEWIWFAGVALLAVISAIRYGLLRRKLRCSIPVRENIYLADEIPTAFVVGLVHPKIYLPSALAEGEWEYVLAHERCHIRRCDPLIRLLSFAALGIHWFNPLVWLAFYLAGQDMEMSCDEAVLKQLGEGIRKDYSQSLLNLSAGRRFAFTPLAFGEGNTGKRIRNLGKWKKPVLWIVVIAAVLCTVLAVCLLTDPMGKKQPVQTQPINGAPPILQLPSNIVTIPEGEFSYPFYGFPAVEWEKGGNQSVEVVVHYSGRPKMMYTWDQDGQLQMETAGEITYLCKIDDNNGQPFCYNAYRVFFADLTGDGIHEVCSVGWIGNGLCYTAICVYDPVQMVEYKLSHSPNGSYEMMLVDGCLWVYESLYEVGGEYSSGAYGPLTLQQQGDSMIPVIMEPSQHSYEMTPSTSTLTGGYDGYLFVTINGSTYRYQRQTVDPQGLTADSYLGLYYENTVHNVDHRTVYRVYSTKEYTDYTVLLVEADGVWMSYRYAPAQRISDDTWQKIRNTEGLVILEDGKAALGQEYFLAFYKKTQQGESCSIQTASYYTIDPDRMVDQLYQTVAEDYPRLFLHTLSYDGEKFTISWEENDSIITRQYSYLMCYTGTSPQQSTGYSQYIRYVLTNDNTVTWEDIFHGMVSSQMGAYIDHFTMYTDYIP